MDTNRLRTWIAEEAKGFATARIWPNGLGFDFRGWSFSVDERTNLWWVSRAGERSASGETAKDALAAVRKLVTRAR